MDYTNPLRPISSALTMLKLQLMNCWKFQAYGQTIKLWRGAGCPPNFVACRQSRQSRGAKRCNAKICTKELLPETSLVWVALQRPLVKVLNWLVTFGSSCTSAIDNKRSSKLQEYWYPAVGSLVCGTIVSYWSDSAAIETLIKKHLPHYDYGIRRQDQVTHKFKYSLLRCTCSQLFICRQKLNV